MLLNRFSILLSNLKSEIKSTLLNTFTSESMTTIRQMWLICLRKTLWRGVAHFDHIKLTVKIHIKNRQPSIHHQYYVKSYNCTRWCISANAHRYQSAFFFAKISHLSLSAAVRYLFSIDMQWYPGKNGNGKGFRLWGVTCTTSSVTTPCCSSVVSNRVHNCTNTPRRPSHQSVSFLLSTIHEPLLLRYAIKLNSIIHSQN